MSTILLLWEKTTGDAVALFTLVLCLFTAVLAVSTIALWRTTKAAAQRQSRDTEILQRAYVSVQAGGIRDTTHGYLVAHVKFRNVGHLPASEIRWGLALTPSDDASWSPPPINDGDLRDAGVLPIGTSIRRGSPPAAVPSDRFLYAWCRATIWMRTAATIRVEVAAGSEVMIGLSRAVRKHFS